MMLESAAAIVWAEQPEADIAAQAAELEALADQKGLKLGGQPIVARTGAELARIIATLAAEVIVVSSATITQGWLDVLRCRADVVTPLRRWPRTHPDAPTPPHPRCQGPGDRTRGRTR
ncbi:hypothetical protein [Nocardia sp. CY41]|uniref:hypothetical protein n=1 Tax=Nocardia sp. CY41 TaxID=2608686 RepID=UPI00135B70A9|nr:hypothetical protein [Nocardia sp. CY41]